MAHVFAICDPEIGYVRSFSDYLARQGSFAFEVQGFTSAESVARFTEKRKIEILLISEKLAFSLYDGDAEPGEPVGCTIILSESGRTETGIAGIGIAGIGKAETDFVQEREERDYPSKGGAASVLPTVGKYQPVGDIVRCVLAIYSENRETDDATIVKAGSTLTGVFGITGSAAARFVFGVNLGRVRAEKGPVLLLCLDACGGVENIIRGDSGKQIGNQYKADRSGEDRYGGDRYGGDRYGGDRYGGDRYGGDRYGGNRYGGDQYGGNGSLSDLMYIFRRGKGGIACGVNSLVRRIGNLDYIPAPCSPEDLSDVDGTEWRKLCEELLRTSSYRELIVIVGPMIRSPEAVLECCAEIWMAEPSDPLEKALEEQTADAFLQGKAAALRERVRRGPMLLPEHPSAESDYFEEAFRGRPGYLVRALRKSERE